MSINDFIPEDHLARDIWNYVSGLDLNIVLNKIKSTDNTPGRPAIDPKILLALWLYATLDGVNSSREIEECTKMHDAYKWICGGVNVNYHSISDFRSEHGDQLNELLTQSVAILSEANIISLEKISQDGMRVRANAGGSSFRRKETLEDHLVLATMYLEDLEKSDLSTSKKLSREKAAKKRAAEEKLNKVQKALETLEEIRKTKKEQAKKSRESFKESDVQKLRASTTDPDARKMKMADGGFRPAYNIQFGTTNIGKAIVGVSVLNKGSDSGQAPEMIDQVVNRTGVVPSDYLLDTGYDAHKNLDELDKKYPELKIYQPEKYNKKIDGTVGGNNNSQTISEKKNIIDSEPTKNWKDRMNSELGKKTYKMRSETAEYSNAQARNRGMQQFRVRGIEKVSCVTLMYAIAHNMTIAFSNILS
jgi:transposase